MISKDSASKNKRKSSKSLLIRLSESCNSHRTKFHNPDDHDHDIDCDDSDPFPQCESDMKALRGIIPMIEASCQCPEVKRDGADGNNASSSDGITSSNVNDVVDPKEVHHLCLFYISVLDGAYCPHSIELLFDHGRGGVEIFPRVHQLFRHLSSDSIVQDAIRTLKRRCHNSFSKDVSGGSHLSSVSDQIVHTCAALLHSIPHANIQIDIVHDFIKLLRDLGTLHSIGIFDNDDSAHDGNIRVALFSHNRSENEFEVALVTKEALLLLQSSVFQLLFQLCAMQNSQQSTEESDSKKGLFQDNFSIDGEHRVILLRCIGEVLKAPSRAKNDDSPTCVILLMKAKIAACHLLHLILPEYGCHASALGVGGAQWTAIVDMFISALRNHLVELECREDSNDSNECLFNWMSDSISNQMAMLLRNTFISPLLQCNSLSNQIWSLQSKFVHRLFDCLPAISKIRGSARESKKLSAMILRAIQISLFPDALKSNVNGMPVQHEVDQFLQSLFDYCNVNNLWSPLVSLLSSFSYSMVAISIVAQLIGSCEEDLIVQRACSTAIENKIAGSNKRRRLDQSSTYESFEGDDDYCGDMKDVSIISPFVNYLLVPLKEMGELPSCPIDGVDDPDVTEEVMLLMLQRDGLKAIFDAIFVIESLLIQMDVALASKHLSVISLLKQFYEVGVLLSKTLVLSCSNGCLDYSIEGARPRIINFVGSMSRILHNDKVARVLCNTLNPVRQELSRLVFDATIQYWTLYSPPTKLDHIVISDIESSQPLDDAKESVVGLSSNQVDVVNKYLKSHIIPCGKACRRLAHCLGVPFTHGMNTFTCTCHLLGDGSISRSSTSDKIMHRNFLESSFIMLAESILPVQNWSILSASLYASRTIGIKIKLVDSITKSPNMSDDTRIAFIASLPFALFAFANALPAKTLNLGQLLDEALEQLKMIDLATVCSPLLQCREKDRLQFYATVILESISRTLAFNVDLAISMPAHNHVSINTIASSEDNYNDLPIDHIGIWRSLLIDPMESCHKLLTTATPQDTKVLNQAIDLLKAINFKGDTLSTVTMRKTLFDCLVLLCISCPEESLARLVAIRIETTESVNNIGSTNNSTEVQLAHLKNPLNILQWLLRVPFSDENEGLRTYAGRWLGALLPFSRYKLLKSLYISEINSNLQQYFIPTRLFDDVDNMLHEFCGLTQSELSYTMKTVETAGTYSSNTNMHEVTKSCSRQISAIRFISGLCQHLEEGDEWKSLILEKGLIRLMRFWVSASMQALEERYDSLNHGEVAEEAFRELLCLRQMGIFSNKEIPNFDQAVVPGFMSDIISKTLFAQSVKSRAGNSDYGNSLLCQFVQFFLVGNPIDDCTSSEIDRLYKVLGCFDSALPATIAGLVLEKDYEAICECTKFRLYLLSELKRLGRKSKDDSLIDEKILGEIASKRKQSSSKASSDEELRRQTSRLCVMKGNDFNILGPILNVLLLEQDKSPLVFFLKKVVGSKVSFGVLLKKSEFMVLDDLVCELGICEEQPGDNDFAREVLKTFYQDQRAYQAMKRAVLFLQSVKDTKQQSSEESLSCSFDINDDSSLTTMNTDQLVEEWVRKYYMRLLVNVTTKWKRGSLQTKISAMRCLRVLLRFIPIEDSPQYATQVFGIVDGCMYLDSNFAETDKRLQFLAVRCLSCFVRVLLSFNLQVVGDNLCNIIVSLSPLFNEVSTDIIASNNENPILSQTVNDAIEILETLVDGKIGKKLAPYFESVPFLPKDSRLHNVRDTLKRHGINFDNLLLLSTQLNCSEPPVRSRDSISSSLSSSVEEEKVLTSHRNKVHFALKKRLNSLEKLLNHENDNVRKLSLMHIIGVVSEHRDLFQNVIKVEDASLRFLTVKSDSLTIKDGNKGLDSFVKSLLQKCASEKSNDLRLMLASCLGEIGAISPAYLDSEDSLDNHSGSNSSRKWILEKGAPWKSKSVRIHYELQLVTNHFVTALKAAPSPTDQHKIGFSIQELLKQLHHDTSDGKSDTDAVDNSRKEAMSPWLKDQLEKAEVLTVIEPYWTSLYTQNEASKTKSPPFFASSKSYYLWLAEWGRYMVEKSNMNTRSCYRNVFYACRSAVRSEAGLGVLEFLLPLLVLDALCFGNDTDKKSTVNELRNVLTEVETVVMHTLERQKSVECVFTIFQTLQYWAESEVEDRNKKQRLGKHERSKGTANSQSNLELPVWSPEESITVIEDLVDLVPFDLRSKAAARVGMHAQSLRCLEMHSRKFETQVVFNNEVVEELDSNSNENLNGEDKRLLKATHIVSMDVGLAHRLLGKLSDRDSMSALLHCQNEVNLFDQIYEKKSYKDWDSVLRLCELTSQIQSPSTAEKFDLENSLLEALLELGHFESVLKHIDGTINSKPSQVIVSLGARGELLSHAVKASWQLGRWDALEDLVHLVDSERNTGFQKSLNHDQEFDFAVGKAMLRLQRGQLSEIPKALEQARHAIIPPLSVVANEDYPRAYPYLLKLQSLREIEDAGKALSKHNDTPSVPQHILNGANFSSALDAETSMDITTVRLALARIGSDLDEEASLWLSAGRKARKEGLFHVAENSLSHANAIYLRLIHNTIPNVPQNLTIKSWEVKLQLSKVKYANGQTAEAIQMLNDRALDKILQCDREDQELANLMKRLEGDNLVAPFARCTLQVTEWMVESGLQTGSEAIERYKILSTISPKWERAHYKYAKYLDSVLESRINVVASQNGGNSDNENSRAKIIKKEKTCHKYIFEAMKEYIEALKIGQKHVFQALPRMLTLWFDFTAILDGDDEMGVIQDEANAFMVKHMKAIPAASFYSVLPQLISRIGHKDEDTVTVVCAILRRLLVKFPAQALWQLSWLRQSVHKDRQKKGEDIFKGAQKNLRKSEDMAMHDLLETSKNLVEFLINLAKYSPKRSDQRTINIHSNAWKGKVELREFLPPVQAALTVSSSSGPSANSRDPFPRQVPRMRAFSPTVHMMASKARPKKLSAFAIAEGTQVSETLRDSNKAQPSDIGEMHFLVKREAKGDLRKDARVQDFNTVINRLFANAAGSQSTERGQHRRLKLRTFSVVCLSEDCGILEWVPNTESFRNSVSKSYNPHASHYSPRRRGRRITNFQDATLRNSFMQCQDQYIKHGNLTKAAQDFDEGMLKEYPPVFYWWFVRNFQDPHKWFEARTRFALSAAAWAAVGHVIGLGDRHSENILLDTSCGECVHVDFDCIFDKGLSLPRPEVIPFRLTPNMLDGLGPTGADGAFTGGLKSAMTTLRDNRDILLSVLDPFLRDPVIDWKRQRAQQKTNSESNSNTESLEAKRSIRVIDERLRGIYNLKNPNYKKIKRVDRKTQDFHDEMASMLPLSVEGQVHKMIAEATSHENLVQVYVGWMPWL